MEDTHKQELFTLWDFFENTNVLQCLANAQDRFIIATSALVHILSLVNPKLYYLSPEWLDRNEIPKQNFTLNDLVNSFDKPKSEKLKYDCARLFQTLNTDKDPKLYLKHVFLYIFAAASKILKSNECPSYKPWIEILDKNQNIVYKISYNNKSISFDVLNTRKLKALEKMISNEYSRKFLLGIADGNVISEMLSKLRGLQLTDTLNYFDGLVFKAYMNPNTDQKTKESYLNHILKFSCLESAIEIGLFLKKDESRELLEACEGLLYTSCKLSGELYNCINAFKGERNITIKVN